MKAVRGSKPSFKEKREDTRIYLKTQAVLRVENENLMDITTSGDISMVGILLKTDYNLPMGTPCALELLFKGISSKTSLYINGRVVRQAKEGLGIQFEDIEVDSYFYLNNFLKNTVLDPKTLLQEIFPCE
jgi:hypothetical protein